MILEFITYLREKPKHKEAKTFGHLKESISLLYKEKRCRSAWANHRKRAQNFIESNIPYSRHFDSILILGSGPLHEIPIEIISRKFKEVTLVDIVHLKETKKKVAHLSNLRFIEHDITEIEAELSTKNSLQNKIPEAFLDEDWGLVLSINLMSQLPIHFRHFLEQVSKTQYDPQEINCFLENLTKNHLDYLLKFPAPVLMMTDTSTHYYDQFHTIIQTDETFPHLRLPKAVDQWTWDVAPLSEFQKNVSVKMTVQGFRLNSR